MAYVTLGEIARYFVDENKALVKGENAVEPNHVVAVTQDPEGVIIRKRMSIDILYLTRYI